VSTTEAALQQAVSVLSDILDTLQHQSVIAVQTTPDALTDYVQGAGNISFGTFNIVSFPIYVPAEQYSAIVILPPPGFWIQVKRVLRATCNNYFANVVVTNFLLNGQSILQVGLDYVMDQPKEFESAVDLLVGHQGMGIELELYNPSLSDATVFIAAEALHITDLTVKQYMQPALDAAYQSVLRVTGVRPA